MITEIVHHYQSDLVDELTSLQKDAFPPHMQFEAPGDYYRQGLSDKSNINVLIRSAGGGVAGYLLALPQARAAAELRPWDPTIEEDPDAMYIDIIQTSPEHRQMFSFVQLMAGACAETKRRGFSRLSAHVRTRNGLSRLVRKLLPDSSCYRRLENWYDSGEAFEFIAASPVMRKGQC